METCQTPFIWEGITMPLSEQEQRLLEEMERSLYQNDADFVAPARRGRTNYTFVAVGVLVAVVGIAVLVTGVVVRQPLVGILGFVVMFGGVLLAATPRKSGAASSSGEARRTRSAGSRSFMENLEDRWDRRQDGRD